MSELMITLAAVVAVCGAGSSTSATVPPGAATGGPGDDPAALPPETAVPVDSALVQRLYATRTWSETRRCSPPTS